MSTINREAFLADPNVAEMVGWVAARFDDASGWTHTWVDRKNGHRWSSHGLRDAFLHYRWNGGIRDLLPTHACAYHFFA